MAAIVFDFGINVENNNKKTKGRVTFIKVFAVSKFARSYFDGFS